MLRQLECVNYFFLINYFEILSSTTTNNDTFFLKKKKPTGVLIISVWEGEVPLVDDLNIL